MLISASKKVLQVRGREGAWDNRRDHMILRVWGITLVILLGVGGLLAGAEVRDTLAWQQTVITLDNVTLDRCLQTFRISRGCAIRDADLSARLVPGMGSKHVFTKRKPGRIPTITITMAAEAITIRVTGSTQKLGLGMIQFYIKEFYKELLAERGTHTLSVTSTYVTY